ncbi:peptide deformylase [Magnetococcus marinus MC-1]|uniref:Peptide deformylase n=1 Tax=Magnetococcus marinus (strain ATCC BAA-1437 / JCM 17883 / MC-1) TaxID=156889 RepID=A0L3X6_MAGMM|nr:peptide deformylase [Magnetococcus marinus]ABK42669.1 peptide deformylase [Magnetococcus marinus MC-1]
MAILPIVTAPDPVLKKRAEPVVAVDASIQQLMRDMLETMYAAPGIGLAAPQVGVSKRVIVVDVTYSEAAAQDGEPYCLANPEIIAAEGEITWEEGCLSVPESYGKVDRKEHVVVRGLNAQGELVTLEAHGLFAVCLQHEIDHLDGTLFIDHLSSLKRTMIIKKLKKLKTEQAS